MKNVIFFSSIIILGLFIGSCASSDKKMNGSDKCSNYPEPQSSKYSLPFAIGEKFKVIQGNCEENNDIWTHFEKLRYSYDFEMPIGSKITASRAGMVIFVRDQFTDNDHGQDQGNAIIIVHNDTTIALYGHLTNKGSLVKVGEMVKEGQVIGLSGNSGESPVPHLHFQVNNNPDFSKANSLPVTFKNAKPNPGRLNRGEFYEAENYENK